MRLGIISNWDSRLRSLLEALDLAREFDSITVSFEAGAEKPSRAIFEHALASLGVGPSEAFHVGDDPVSDLEGPHGAGMRAALLVRQGEAPPGALNGLDGIIPLLEAHTGEMR